MGKKLTRTQLPRFNNFNAPAGNGQPPQNGQNGAAQPVGQGAATAAL